MTGFMFGGKKPFPAKAILLIELFMLSGVEACAKLHPTGEDEKRTSFGFVYITFEALGVYSPDATEINLHLSRAKNANYFMEEKICLSVHIF
jgi:hypothetical protein